MRFLADESCDFAIVRALSAAGFDITSIARSMPGATDEQVIGLAFRESRILLTEDKDFGQLVFASAARSPGVVLIRFPARVRGAMVASVIALVSDHAERLAQRFTVLEPGRVRISERL